MDNRGFWWTPSDDFSKKQGVGQIVGISEVWTRTTEVAYPRVTLVVYFRFAFEVFFLSQVLVGNSRVLFWHHLFSSEDFRTLDKTADFCHLWAVPFPRRVRQFHVIRGKMGP
jgi:hypothetical protein